MRITGAILAAGMSTRMGQNKLLLPFQGTTVIGRVLHSALATSLDEILVITGHERERVERIIENISDTRLHLVFNANFARGRAESIKTAVREAKESDAILFLVGDKPIISTALIEKTITEFREQKPNVCYVQTPHGRGHPVIFSQELFPELLALEGDIVGDNLIASHANDTLEVGDDEMQWDIDTWDDYQQLIVSRAEASHHD
jgi:molybdenum cofactor cytidylyltransferase